MTKNNSHNKTKNNSHNNVLRGTGVAMITPFLKDEKIDFKSLEKLYHYLVKGGVDYLVPLGTTAETATLTNEERKEVLQFIVDLNKKNNIPLVVGIGGNSTKEVLHQFDIFPLEKVKAILSVSPYYNKPSQEGLYQHYAKLAKESPLPIVLYNVPGRTARNLHYNTTIRLAKNFSNIIGLKEASGDINQALYLAKYCPKAFTLVSGDDNLSTALMSIGFQGAISVIANAFPKTFKKMMDYGLNNDFQKAAQIQKDLLEITDMLFEENNPAGIKVVLTHLGIIKNYLRLPLVPISSDLEKKIIQTLKRIQIV